MNNILNRYSTTEKQSQELFLMPNKNCNTVTKLGYSIDFFITKMLILKCIKSHAKGGNLNGFEENY